MKALPDHITLKPHELNPIAVPQSCNYIGVFLTLSCNLRCSYCINRYSNLVSPRRMLSAAEWLRGLNRLQSRPDLPITLQGGEPSLHPGFYDIINGIRPDLNIDLLTNLQFDVETFMARVVPARIRRNAPYASIRVSYHPETMNLSEVKQKVLFLLGNGYSVGIWAVDHPAWQENIRQARSECEAAGIDFRVKEFLGVYQGRKYGTYKYDDAADFGNTTKVECRTSELLFGPSGNVYRCHSDLYGGREHVGDLLDPESSPEVRFTTCHNFGTCNPCDVKVKTNRFQEFGHTSVEIRFQR